MKSPLWIVNSILALLFFAMLIFVIVSFKSLYEKPRVAPLKITQTTAPLINQEPKAQDRKSIYDEHDLFGTFSPSIIPVQPVEQMVPPVPTPPFPLKVKPIAQPVVQFLDPLPIKITGIIYSSNDAKSQVTMVNNNTRKSESYKMGDKLFDAHIIRIFPRKIIIVRSNGQQETLFMYSSDAQAELKAMQEITWTDVVQMQRPFAYLVNPTAFASRVISLANLIEMLDMTTASTNNKNTGIRIGNMEPTSIGYELGFIPGDIITKVADLAPTSTALRMKIYNAIIQKDLGSDITVQFLRQEKLITHTYRLFNLADITSTIEELPIPVAVSPAAPVAPAPAAHPVPQAPAPAQPHATQQLMEAHHAALAQEQQKNQGPIRQIRRTERNAMKQYGNKAAIQPMAGKT
jgi:type II secretory pathway component PulC